MSRISFIDQLGDKRKEGWLKKRSGNNSSVRFNIYCREDDGEPCCCCYVFCCQKWVDNQKILFRSIVDYILVIGHDQFDQTVKCLEQTVDFCQRFVRRLPETRNQRNRLPFTDGSRFQSPRRSGRYRPKERFDCVQLESAALCQELDQTRGARMVGLHPRSHGFYRYYIEEEFMAMESIFLKISNV